jgi:hypothetical protein
MILTLNIRFTHVSDLVTADDIIINPPVPITAYRDGFGNWCSRIVAPQGDIRISTDAIINDSGLPDTVDAKSGIHYRAKRRRDHPGQPGLSPGEREMGVDALFRPYHDAIDRLLDGRAGRPTLLLSIHSFTPVLDHRPRPWKIGVSSWRDRRLAALLLGALARGGGIIVGGNEPYLIDDEIDYTIAVHGEGRGLPGVMIEIRQDEIRTAAGAAVWAARMAEAYQLIEAEAVRFCESCLGAYSASGGVVSHA